MQSNILFYAAKYLSELKKPMQKCKTFTSSFVIIKTSGKYQDRCSLNSHVSCYAPPV